MTPSEGGSIGRLRRSHNEPETNLTRLWSRTGRNSGGNVVLCPHCAAAVGIEAANVREGAMIGIPEDQTIPNMLLAADTILDF